MSWGAGRAAIGCDRKDLDVCARGSLVPDGAQRINPALSTTKWRMESSGGRPPSNSPKRTCVRLPGGPAVIRKPSSLLTPSVTAPAGRLTQVTISAAMPSVLRFRPGMPGIGASAGKFPSKSPPVWLRLMTVGIWKRSADCGVGATDGLGPEAAPAADGSARFVRSAPATSSVPARAVSARDRLLEVSASFWKTVHTNPRWERSGSTRMFAVSVG